MAESDDPTRPLRDALRVSPENRPLHLHLAETLAGLGRWAEAEDAYRQALNRWPDDLNLKVGLAKAFMRQEKASQAEVLVESMLKQPDTPGRVYVLHARLLLKQGEVERAVRQYKRGLEDDPEAGDAELAAKLGLNTDGTADGGEVVEGRVRAAAEPAEGDLPAGKLERPALTFADVGGLEHVKEEVRLKIILPMQQPELFKAYDKPIGGGILMYGPPGCGKTHLARATAGEVKAHFLAIGINDVLDMWIGQSERNLHELFDHARRHRPCVLFFDEVDALGASRSDMRQSAGRHLINQFLSELDGVKSNNEGLLILAATNAPWHLDSAFRRPGRFDRIIFVPPPDLPARVSILDVLCRGKPTGKIDQQKIAKQADGFSGADLKATVDVAVEAKLKEALKTGKIQPLETRDLVQAAKGVKPSTREWFATARNYALYSNQGGVYDDILKYLKI